MSDRVGKKRKADRESRTGSTRFTKRPTRVVPGQAFAEHRAKGQVENKASLTLADTVGEVRHVPEQPEENVYDEQPQRLESLDIEPPDDLEQHDIAATRQRISMIESGIVEVNKSISEIHRNISEINKKERLAEEAICALDEPDILAKLFSDPNKQLIKTIISEHQSTLQQDTALRRYIHQCGADKLVLRSIILEKTKVLVQELAKLRRLQGNLIIRKLPSKKSDEDDESGIVYIEDIFRIEIEGEIIGLLIKGNRGPVQLKPDSDIPVLNLSTMLDDIWSLLDVKSSKKAFHKKLCAKVPWLSKKFVKNACYALADEYELGAQYRPGKMSFQQFICTPFAKLLMAAAGEDGFADPSYKAAEDVCSSLSVIRKAKHNVSMIQKRKLVIKPDSAATLYPKWDAFGMMEIKAKDPCDQEDYLIDNDNCVLMTAVTAIAVRKCIKPQNYGEVLLPFIISTGDHAALYVTGLNQEGTPVVSFVKYPDGTDSSRHDISSSSSEGRKKLFIAFAMLLNNFKNFFETSVKESYNGKVKNRIKRLASLEEYAPNSRATTTQNNAETDSDTNDGNTRQDSRAEHMSNLPEKLQNVQGCSATWKIPLVQFFFALETVEMRKTNELFLHFISKAARHLQVIT